MRLSRYPDEISGLEGFFFRVLCIFDGIEGKDLSWKGVSLVASEDLPDNVDEINDDFLHDEWSNRSDPYFK